MNEKVLKYSNHIISERVRKQIVNKHYDGIPHDIIADEYDLKESTIDNYVKRYETTDTVLSEYEIRRKGAKKGVLPRAKLLDDQQLQNYLIEKCTAWSPTALRKYSGDVENEFGVIMGKNIVDRFFKSKGWKLKTLSRIAIEVDLEEEYIFWQLIDEIVTDPNQMIFLDESSRCNRTANPRKGRGPPGYAPLSTIYFIY